MMLKVFKERIELKEGCGCDKKLYLIGSSTSGYYTICECNKVGYFDDDKGRELHYQRETNSDENSFLTDTE